MIYRVKCTMQTYPSYIGMRREFYKEDAISVLPDEFKDVRNFHYKIVDKYPFCSSRGLICYRMTFTVDTTEDIIKDVIERYRQHGLCMDNASYKLIKE